MHRYTLPGAIWILFCLTACSTTETPSSTVAWPELQARLLNLHNWEAQGKLALRTSESSESASFQWQQEAEQTRLQLSGPLGLNALTIESNGQRLTLRRGNQTQHWDLSNGQTLALESGGELPISSLPYWLKGLPDPHRPVERLQLDQTGQRLLLLSQGDWVVRVDDHDLYGQLLLPTRLALNNGTTSATILIRNWQLADPS